MAASKPPVDEPEQWSYFYTLDQSTPLMAQMTRPGGINTLYVVLLIKINIFHIFHPKI